MQDIIDQFRSALHTIWNRRWIALAVAWGVCVLGWMAVALIPNSYESRARIFVELEDVLGEELQIANGGEEAITRVRQTLTSTTNLEKIIRSTRLGDKIQTDLEMQNAVADLSENIRVSLQQENLFEITATIGRSGFSDAENAKLAQEVVQRMIDLFREQNIADNRGDVAQTMIFLEQALEERKAELEAIEERRLAFEAANPEAVAGAGASAMRLQTMRSEMRNVDSDIAAAQSSLAAINGQIAGTPRTIVTAGAGGGPQGALIQAESQLAAMRARGLTDNHPDVVAQLRQVEALRQQASAAPANSGGTINPAYSSLVSIRAERQANVQALQARKVALQSDITALIASQASEPAVAAEARRISRDYEVQKEKYDELLQSRERMRVRGDYETNRNSFQFDVIDPPILPQTPAAPNRPLLLVGVLMAGLAIGAGVAFILGLLRSSFTTAERLESALDLPVIGTISRSMTDAAARHQKLRLKQFFAGSGALAALCLLLLVVEIVQVSSVA
ncbi:XrtA system polysaccharide chain length determinant [Qipengyuania nanhaisediminis]|uniref:Polysaccharide chain length determinant protein, PEP-CTERM locus subfamily n=1 Tax=Qipengyuania nanhaisediminis TaxID=604088 RepID=A0A1I5MQ61_9SPHN|nr:XrtA system polysaccharide chain length determinant [Qipengyuania nanhaisediminis]SFP11735.1 polysaccharide chain length determinant protein, PEP-CTERM locus subfamily [Qipengyuania nanhaisediminis]